MSTDCISIPVSSRDGVSIHAIIFSGAPAFTAASRTIFAASIVDLLALGCGLIIIPFLVFNAIKILKKLNYDGIVYIPESNGEKLFFKNKGSNMFKPLFFLLI